MARTPLFGWLRRALGAAHASHRTGSTPDELARAAISRRSVLRGLGAAAVVPLVPKLTGCGDNIQGRAEADGDPTPRVAIVGGGMAGLHCAYRLREAGVRATIYEASDRTGGRIFTGRDLPGIQGGQIVELGGELIDSDHTTMMGLAADFGFALDDLQAAMAGLRADTFHFDGGVVADAQIVSQFTPLAALMDSTVTAAEEDDAEFERVDAMSIPEWLETEAGIPPARLIYRILLEAYRIEYGLEPEEQSIFNLLYLIDYSEPDPFRIFGDSDERYHVHAGNDSITGALAAAVADQIVLGHRLARVARRGGQYALAFDTGGATTEVVVDHVVLALPFSTLRMVDLEAGLFSDDKLDVIQNLGYGTNAKLMLQFASPTWRQAPNMASGSSFTDVGQLQSTWDTTRGQTGTQGILTDYLGGTRGLAIGDLSAGDAATQVLPWIDTVFPGTAAEYVAGSAVLQHWPSQPYHRGSYACYRPGQWAYYGLEGERAGRIYFCGEHCSLDYQGYMEGAAETGGLVALEVMRELGLTPPARLVDLMAPKLVLPQACFAAPAARMRRRRRRQLGRERVHEALRRAG